MIYLLDLLLHVQGCAALLPVAVDVGGGRQCEPARFESIDRFRDRPLRREINVYPGGLQGSKRLGTAVAGDERGSAIVDDALRRLNAGALRVDRCGWIAPVLLR